VIVKVNDEVLFELTDLQKKVIMNDIPTEIFEDDIKRRLKDAIMHRYKKSLARLKRDWEPILSERVAEMPLDPEAFVALIKSQPDYKDKYNRENPVKEIEGKQ